MSPIANKSLIVNRRLFLSATALGALAGLSVATAPTAMAAGNSEIAFNYFVAKGLSQAQSAGLVGNFIVESGADPINPSAAQFGGGPGRGIAQWEGSRRTDLFNYAATRGLSWDNLGLQLDFVWKELTSTESNALNKLRATSTPSAAAVAVRTYYERPSVHNDAGRISAAESVFSRFSGGTTTPPTGEFPVLRQGSSGAAVTTVQYLLSERGYAVSIDSSFGPGTDSAVRAFQQAQGLTPDGIVGTNTWLSLIVVLRSGSSGQAVRGLQTQLRQHGYGSVTVDGAFGLATDSAVRAFQQANGLSADGIAGPATWRALV